MKILRRSSFVAMTLMLAAASAVQAQVLDLVPANAPFVFKVNNLKGASDKIAAMATKWGISAMSPMLSNPLASLKQQANITNGLKESGDMAFVITSFSEDKEPPMLILAPVSDYKAFLGNFQGAKTEGDLTEVQFPNNPQPSYVAHWGDYAAISNDKATLGAKPAGIKTDGPAAKELSDKDAVLFINMAAVRAKVVPELQQNRQKILNDMTDHLSAKPESQKYIPLATALANRAMDVAESFLDNCDAVTWGLSFSADGMGSTLLTQFKPQSQWAENLGQMQQSDKPLVQGLPISKYLVYGGMIGSPELGGKLIDDLVGPLKGELAKLGEQGKIAQQFIDALEKNIKNTKGSSFGFLAPANPAQGSLLQGVSVTRGNAKAIVESATTMAKAQNEMAQQTKPDSAKRVTVATDAKSVAGVHFDAVRTDMSGQADSPQEAQAQQFLNFVYGSTTVEQYFGVVNDDHVLSVSGLDDATIAKAIEAAKAGESHLTAAKQVQAVESKLPNKRFFAFYIPLDNVLTTGAEVARDRAGMQVNLQVPADLQPIGITGSTDGNALRFDGYMPAELVQNLISSGMQAMGQVMQSQH
jgi:hypothetical protein